MYDWYNDYDKQNKKMNGKTKHPFAISCRKCGSNRITVFAAEYRDLEIKCEDCGCYVDCGIYYTWKDDYSKCTNI